MDNNKIVIEHQYFKPKKFKKLRRLKNIFLFGLYIGAVAVIVNFADGNKIKTAFAGNAKELDATQNAKNDDNYANLTIEEKMKIKFFEKQVKNVQIARICYTESKDNDVDPELMLAIMKIESNFNPKAINYNKNGSIDRGLCQLNSFVFSNLKLKEFFDPKINIEHGVKHIKWCLDQSENNLVKALAMYNAGYGSVANTKVGERTLNYIQKIIDYKDLLSREEKEFLKEYKDILN